MSGLTFHTIAGSWIALANLKASKDQSVDTDERDQSQPCPKCGGAMIIIETFMRGQTPKSRAPPWEDAA